MKELETKIALLYKTSSEWAALGDSYIPLKGEVCFCEFPKDSAGQDILFKVGNGVDSFNDLSWGMAITPDFE